MKTHRTSWKHVVVPAAGHTQARLSPQMTGRRAHTNAAACVGNCLIAELYTIHFLWQHHQLTPRDKYKGLGCPHSEHCGCSSVGPRTAGVGSGPHLTHDKGPGCSQSTHECGVSYSASPVKTSVSFFPHLWEGKRRSREMNIWIPINSSGKLLHMSSKWPKLGQNFKWILIIIPPKLALKKTLIAYTLKWLSHVLAHFRGLPGCCWGT